MKFNINDTVRVRLTDYGRAVLRDDWQSTTNIYYARPEQRAIRGEYKPPKEDENGWSEWQLWALMEAFGEHTGNGCRLSFETEIEIVGAEVAKAEVAALKAQADPLPATTYGVDPANGRDYTVIADIGADGRVESVRIHVPEEDEKEAKP